MFGKWSWVLNGLFFALYHSFQLWLFPMLLFASLTSSLVVYKTKSIVPGFVFHFIANFLLAIFGILYLILN
ncbi:MAG: CPBP family intramembrane metalloprotease [Bacteroidales bacterium]|nr:CPBP family intramembrane metalloprotease [Bacteroidales bacterium]